MSNILLTGSSGFIGQYLSSYLKNNKYCIVNTYRNNQAEHFFKEKDKKNFVVGSINAKTLWHLALSDCDIVVHLAARVHVMQETHIEPLNAFREVNTLGTINLARQAAAAGVKRFIYLSTIKVNGDATSEIPFYADDVANPQDPYAISKFEAEQQLLALASETGLEVVIIRPPLVYGPAVKGNFKRLIQLLKKSIPLPFSRINNSRSLVNIQNLCSLIHTCLVHPKAVNEVFLVSDGQDLSTSDILNEISQALGKKNNLFYFPQPVLKWVASLFNRQAEYDRLFGSLQVDISKNSKLLGWEPKISVAEAMAKTVVDRA